MSRQTFLWVALCIAAAPCAARAAEQVVLETNAAAYTAGQTMDTGASLRLDAGEFVVIATDDGLLRRIEGPHNGPAATAGTAPSPSAVRRALAQLVSSGRPQVGGIGAVRGTADDAAADTRPEVSLLHAERNGDQCVIRGGDTALWREDSERSATAEISDSASSNSAGVRWEAAEHAAAWPEALPLVNERIYFVRPSESLRSTAVRVHVLESAVAAEPLVAAGWFAAKGCVDQARILLRAAPAAAAGE
jgi:hypothetical protein